MAWKDKIIVPLLLVIICLSLFNLHTYGKILLRPYLQAVTTNSISIMMEANSYKNAIVIYNELGSDSCKAASTTLFKKISSSKISYLHRFDLTALKPNTKYSYKVIHENDTSQMGIFITAVEPGTPFTFAVASDFQANPQMHSHVAKEIIKHNPMFSIYIGDLCNSGEYYMWKNEFFIEDECKLIANVPFFNALGNHETSSELFSIFLKAPKSDSHSNNYYSFDYGDVHFLVLNTEEPLEVGTPQYTFAEKDIKETRKKWKIVVAHKPAYFSGGAHSVNKELLQLTTNVFEPNKVDIVMSGHLHFYQHSVVNGIHHLVVASAGGPLANPKPSKDVLVSDKDFHYSIVKVEGNNLSFTAYNIYGKAVDTFDVPKK